MFCLIRYIIRRLLCTVLRLLSYAVDETLKSNSLTPVPKAELGIHHTRACLAPAYEPAAYIVLSCTSFHSYFQRPAIKSHYCNLTTALKTEVCVIFTIKMHLKRRPAPQSTLTDHSSMREIACDKDASATKSTVCTI